MPKYRVTVHTSYSELFEVDYNGRGEDLFDDETVGDWKRVSPSDTKALEAAGSKVESVEEIDA
jgi:hypothetical protein